METLYSPEEVAGILKVNVATVYRLLRDGRLPSSRVASLYRISESQLQSYLSAKPSLYHEMNP